MPDARCNDPREYDERERGGDRLSFAKTAAGIGDGLEAMALSFQPLVLSNNSIDAPIGGFWIVDRSPGVVQAADKPSLW
jgi:hypothetical protein